LSFSDDIANIPAMQKSVAIIGAGVSGLTCGVVFAERGFAVKIFADQIGTRTTSGVAGALWFPYDAKPAEKVIPWALATYKVLAELTKNSSSGVSMIELRQFCRTGQAEIPEWANQAGGGAMVAAPGFSSGFSLRVPLMDTTIYLDYLIERFQKAGGEIKSNAHVEKLEDVDLSFDLVVNCAGIGARELTHDSDLEPHRGQVAIVSRPDGLNCAIVCDDAPLMYVIPRTNDCVFGGTNQVSDNLNSNPATTKAIVAECSRVLNLDNPRVLRERVGLRPFRKSGVRLEKEKLRDGRTVIHNYGHGGSGFTLSWGCGETVFQLSGQAN
jgi:D-amino-acid oxidase